MADIYAETYPDPTKTQKIVDEKYARLRTTPIDLTTTLAVNAISDRLFLGRVPSNARLVDIGQISYGAFGGTAAMNLGFYHPKLTSAENTAAATKLWSAQSIAAASSRKVMTCAGAGRPQEARVAACWPFQGPECGNGYCRCADGRHGKHCHHPW